MRKMFRTLSLLLASLLTVSILAGCGGDDSDSEERVASANFVSANPPGGEIAANGSITVTFDNAPSDVTVSAGTVTVAGKSATITGPFRPSALALTITWADGTQALNYTVTGPDCCGGVPWVRVLVPLVLLFFGGHRSCARMIVEQ